VLVPRQSGALEQASLEKGRLEFLRKGLVGIEQRLREISAKVCLLRDSSDLVATKYFNGELISTRAMGFIERVGGWRC